MKIKEVAAKLHISPRAIRYYEDEGLISPSKQANNSYRTFGDQDVWRLQIILSLREAGMSIEDIRNAFPVDGKGDPEQLLSYMENQRAAVYAQWIELKQIMETTDTMIDLIKQQRTLPLEDLFSLAEASKQLRETRRNWIDRWDFDRQAKTHDNNVIHNQQQYKDYEEALTLTLEWVAPKPGERGLDIGIGTGNLAGKFISSGIQMAGIDQSQEMLKQCQRKYPELELKRGNFLAIPYVDGQFDFIVTSFALHHITDEQKRLALEEMRRVLKPHGRICVADLMFVDNDSKEMYIAELERQGRTDLIHTVQDEYYATSTWLQAWFDANGYITRHRQLNELLHIIYAVPIR